MLDALARRFAALDPVGRRHATGVALCMAVYCFHAVWFSTWLIEDAAISYAFAENLAHGEGPVPTPGAEPVEGFSNPTWTLLLAVTAFFGLPPWITGKLLGLSFGLVCLPLAYLWARRTAEDDDDASGNWPLLAPLILAFSTQHVLWAASGLENGLFDLLLAASAVRILLEGDRPRWGVSGVLLGLLAITRPEAPMYAGVIALLGGWWALRAGGVRWLASFSLGGLAPFLTWHAWRYWTFAWELPNTYYAKQTEEKFKPFGWNQRGWNYLRRWALMSTQGFLIPLFTLGQSGTRGIPGMIGLVATGILLGVCFSGLHWFRTYGPFDLPPEPVLAVQIRVAVLVVAAALFPLLGLGRRGHTARTLAWALTLCALFFALYTGGDWMRGFRWLNMAFVPLSVLLADGARHLATAIAPLADAISERLLKRRVLPGVLALLLVVPVLGSGFGQTVNFLFGLETTPFDVRRRVLYMQGVQKRLHLDHASLLEVDMGAHMWWSGFELTDMAGLVDVPMARHHYDRAFIDTYVHEERNPTFAHVHGGWAKKTGIDKRPWFNPNYVEIPGYGHSPSTFHVGNHVRKDLFVQDTWHGTPGRRVDFGKARMNGLEVPAPLVHPGGGLYVEIGWSFTRRPPGFRALLFLNPTGGSPDGPVVVKELPPAYDWIPVSRWRRKQVMVGRHTLSLPDSLPVGRYDVGIAVVPDDVGGRPFVGVPIGEDGEPDTSRQIGQPVFMAGEARFVGMLEVAPREAVVQQATSTLEAAIEAARAGDCNMADERWSQARRYLPPDDVWHATADPRMTTTRAICWARQAEAEDSPALIRRARQLDHRAAEVQRIGNALADRWEAAGDAALADGDDEAAFARWTDALAADPARAWLRRRAEKLRGRLLAPNEETP
jgi:hypothetical protein